MLTAALIIGIVVSLVLTEVVGLTAGGIISSGGELSWLKAVRPGDELRVECEVLEARPSRSRPSQGFVKVRVTTLNQHSEPVQIFTPTLFVDRGAVDPGVGG